MRRARSVSAWDKPGISADEPLVVLCALLDVRLHEELPARFEKPSDLVEESIANDEPLLVSLFPPRIGEMDEHGAERTVGAEARQGQDGVLREHPRAIAEPAARETPIHHGSPFPANLETEQAGTGLGLGALDHEPATARPDLDFDPVASDEGPQVDAVALG